MRIPTVLGALGILAFLLPGGGNAPPAAGGHDRAASHPAPADGPGDPVVELQRKIDAGEVTLTFDSIRGWLPSVLKALNVPVSSQGLIFSRTSLQVDYISPWTPRAVYFNDDVYVGFVQDGPIMEVAAVDPKEGGHFYTLSQTPNEHPRFHREGTTCLMCHESKSVTEGVPGFIMRSVLTDRYGYNIEELDQGPTTDRTPIAKRWGGWYVTGTVENGVHSGNVHAPVLSHDVSDPERYLANFDMTTASDVTDLTGTFDTTPYLSDKSDLVALMVLAHQTRVHNLITLAQDEAAEAIKNQEAVLSSRGGELPASGYLPSTLSRIDGAVERLLDAMLFVREAPLPGPLHGTSGFAEEFQQRGPRDSKGRSLRDLDLQHRLFKYRMSFLVYTDAFDALPTLVKKRFYERLREVLTGKDTSDRFQGLSAGDRQAILEILHDTKPEFSAMLAQ